MVQPSEQGKPKKGGNDEVDEAKEAQEAADPAINDPSYMPNIIPQTEGEGGKASAKEVADPNPDEISLNPVHSPQATNPPPAQTGFEEHEEAKDGEDEDDK